MSRGRRIFINDNSHMARPGQCVVVSLMTVRMDSNLPVSDLWENTLGDCCEDQTGRCIRRGGWAGKYFIQSQTACNLIILVSVMLVSR